MERHADKSERQRLTLALVGFQVLAQVKTLGFIHNSEKRWIPGKHRLMVRTIQAGSLCYIAFRSVQRSLEDTGAISANPRQPRDGV